MRKKDRKVDVAIIVSQREEYEAVEQVFSIPPTVTSFSLPRGGTFVLTEITSQYSIRRVGFRG